MKRIRFVLIIAAVAAVFVIGFGYGRWYSTRPTAAASGRKILYYVDPMHSWYKSDKPGVAPDCGMKLEPVYADGQPDLNPPSAAKPFSASSTDNTAPPANAFQITPEKQQLVGVRYGQAEFSTDAQIIRAVGRVTPDETRITRVHAKVDGWIEQVAVDFTGQLIRKGQTLLTLYSPELLASQQELLLALKARTLMQHSSMQESVIKSDSLVEATRRRLELWDLGRSQIEEIERTQKPIKSITLYSPAGGYVTARNAFPSQRVTPETELYAITDLSRIWVMADVFEADAPRVRVGQTARVLVPGTSNAYTAQLSYVQPQIDPATRTMKVRLELANPGYRLKPNMFVDVLMEIGGIARLTVPAEAVLDAGTTKTVFLDRGNGFFEPRQVETGERLGDRIEIVKGLKPGERIVISGTFLLNSESQMKSALGGMSGMPGMTHDTAVPPPSGHAGHSSADGMPNMPGMGDKKQ